MYVNLARVRGPRGRQSCRPRRERKREGTTSKAKPPLLTCPRAWRERNVVGEELPILHDEVRVSGRIIEIPVHDGRQDARVRQGMSRHRDPGRRLAVRVVRREEARKAGVCLAPGWVLQVVAAAVRVPVGKVWVADDHLVLLAARNCVPRLARVEVDPGQQLARVGALKELLGGARLELLLEFGPPVAELRRLAELAARGLADGPREQAQVDRAREAAFEAASRSNGRFGRASWVGGGMVSV